MFFHHPKCGGASVMYKFHFLNEICHRPEKVSDKKPFRIILYDDNKLITFILYGSVKKTYTAGDAIKIHQNLLTEFTKKIKPNFCIVTPGGFQHVNSEIFKKLGELLQGNTEEFFFTRDPLEREYSFFSYIKSDRSKHESTHNAIKSSCFEEYIRQEMGGSWLASIFRNFGETKLSDKVSANRALEFFNNKWICETKNSAELFNHIIELSGYKDIITELTHDQNKIFNQSNISINNYPTTEYLKNMNLYSIFHEKKKLEYEIHSSIRPKTSKFEKYSFF